MEVINNSTDMDIETATYRSKTGEISLRSIEEVLDNYRGTIRLKLVYLMNDILLVMKSILRRHNRILER